MMGAGALFYAVWGYVISHAVPSREHGSVVELNPALIGVLLGEDAGDVEVVIGRMCEPDPKSRSKNEEGRKLVRLGQYLYRVVNGEKYRAIRDAEERREYQRLWMAEKRKKKQPKAFVGMPGPEPQVDEAPKPETPVEQPSEKPEPEQPSKPEEPNDQS